MAIKAEYIWLDGATPTRQLRSKTKILESVEKIPEWGYDGSSTEQADGSASDCVLKPVFNCPDPIRGGDDILVMCEVYGANGDSGGTIQISRIGNRTTVSGKRIPIGGRDFRFRPGAARFEPAHSIATRSHPPPRQQPGRPRPELFQSTTG